MSRYQTLKNWTYEGQEGPFTLQSCDLRDTRTGHVYHDGAFRVIVTETGKPAVKGKGGTHPYMGETAHSDGNRLLGDLALAERRKGW